MYQRFFGLTAAPFDLTPDPRFLFLTGRHREALSNLEYGLSSSKPLTVLVGEAGTGKTTLLQAALRSERCRTVQCVYLNNPSLTRLEFIEMLAQRFELSMRARESKAVLLTELETLLAARRGEGQVTALVVDEAQSMSRELLEEIRLLANIETTTDKLLPVVLAGQPELADRLNDPALRQLKQRVSLRCEIAPFSVEDTAGYIASRIARVGGNAASAFSREAVMLIHARSRGIPRSINVICDNALLTAYGLRRQPVDSAIVWEVVRDFDFGGADRVTTDAVAPAAPAFAAGVAAAAADPVDTAPPASAEPSPVPFRPVSLLGLR
jgi:type II secretory pathway predicted ATPase ExeA